MNSLFIIQPYKDGGVWMFDDPGVGLVREPFVSGADDILDRLTENIPNATSGFTAIFSATPFPGSKLFEWRREEHGGNWYYSPDYNTEGWLCPALFKYFDAAPERLYVQAKPKQQQ